MPIYNKLVRDRIPDIIKFSGRKPSVRILDDEVFKQELINKSFEQLQEFVNAKDTENAIEELADLLEVIYALAKYHGASPEKMEEVRRIKEEKRGSFKEKIFLIKVDR